MSLVCCDATYAPADVLLWL